MARTTLVADAGPVKRVRARSAGERAPSPESNDEPDGHAPYGRGVAVPDSEFGLGRLVLGDSRIAFHVLNELRYWSLNQAFGATRGQANVLTFVLVLGAAETARQGARRVLQVPHMSSVDATLGALVVREAVVGIAGPAAREMPLFIPLLTAGIVGGAGLRLMRRGAHALRLAEANARRKRINYYVTGKSG
jgi:hypothetical protein